MSNGTLKRLCYFRGQVLTEKDFNDQQEYHIRKLRELAKRFPAGVISGLYVEYKPEKTSFMIKEGLAVDDEGRLIVVSDQGLLVPLSTFRPDKDGNYLSIYYDEEKVSGGSSICDADRRFNRIEERARYVWDQIPNNTIELSDGTKQYRISVAYVTVTGEEPPFKIVPTEDQPDVNEDPLKRPVRVDALLVDERKIIFRTADGHNHTSGNMGARIPQGGLENNAVKEENLNDGAITRNKIRDGAVNDDKLSISALGSDKIAIADEFDGSGQDATTGTGIKMPHIRKEAVTSAKIAIADESDGSVQDATRGTGIKTPHIKNGAVTQDKIAADVSLPIENDAIDSAMIKEADGTSGQDTNNGSGIKTDHIQDGAVTQDKLAVDVSLPIENDAIDSAMIKEADGISGQDTNNGGGIKTGHIQDGAVTSSKLNIDKDELVGSVPAGSPPPGDITKNVEFSGPEFDKPRIVHVVPTNPVKAVLSWTLLISVAGENALNYKIQIFNHSEFKIDYKLQILKLG